MKHQHRLAPSKSDMTALVALFNQRRYVEGELLALEMTGQYPSDGFGWKVLGALLQAQGRHEDALRPMQESARLSPRDPEAHSNLGGALCNLKQFEAAEASHRRALSFAPKSPDALVAYGATLQAQSKWEQAATIFRQTIRVAPRDAYAHRELGVALYRLGSLSEAESSLRRAIALDPKEASAHGNLGAVLKAGDKLNDAERSYRDALALNSNFADAWYNLGICLYAQDRMADAEQAFRQAIGLQPTNPQAYNNLGNTLEALGRFNDSRAAFAKAIELVPDFAEAHCNMGNSLRYLGLLSEAEACYRRALQFKEDLPDAHNYLGYVLAGQQRYAEAEDSYHKAQSFRSQFPEMLTNLGHALMLQGRFAEAEVKFRDALALKPDLHDAQSNILFYKNYTESDSAERCLEEARKYGAMVDSVVTDNFSQWLCPANPVRLRVGIVSANLHSHPVGYFMESVLKHIDATRIELIAYSNHYKVDDLTQRIKPAFAQWRDIHGLRDPAAAKLMHNDALHVLLDLSGHTGNHRLPVFARRPAPVQASWLGYFATTGLTQMDYLLGDPHVTPQDEEWQFTERVWRLPESYLCFTPPNEPLAVAALPALNSGAPTFGCFNNLAKMNDAVVTVWARILAAVPNSRVLLKTAQLSDPQSIATTRQRFAAHGIAAERLQFEGFSARADLLATYHRVDVALDPFPYPGGTTSVEALWMGVPVLTRKGDRFLSHVGESIARNAGLNDWIAIDDDDYVNKAIAAVSDLQALSTLRASLRAQVVASPLFDAPRFARHFEHALWGMWQSRQSPQGNPT
jgi:protein O-GlcNAc transferase